MLTKANEDNIEIPSKISDELTMSEKEIELIKTISLFPEVIKEAGKEHSPAQIANYVYELVKSFNQFYHDSPIVKESDEQIRSFRLALSKKVAAIIKSGMGLLGIDVPVRM